MIVILDVDAIDFTLLETVNARPFVCSYPDTDVAAGTILLCANTTPQQAFRIVGVATRADYIRQWGEDAADTAYAGFYFVEAMD